jgi:hypothetical protein
MMLPQLSHTAIHPPAWRTLAISLEYRLHAPLLKLARARRSNESPRKPVFRLVAVAGCLALRTIPPQTRGGGWTAILSPALGANTVRPYVPSVTFLLLELHHRFVVIFCFIPCVCRSSTAAALAANKCLSLPGSRCHRDQQRRGIR